MIEILAIHQQNIIADEQFYEVVGKTGNNPGSWYVTPKIDGVKLQKQVDTGSKNGFIPLSSLSKIGKAKHQLKPALTLKGYGQKPLSFT